MHVLDYLIWSTALIIAWLVARSAHTGRHSTHPAHAGWRVLVGFSAGIGLLALVTLWLQMPHDPWNAARLTPMLALQHGYALYSPSNSGVVLSTVVGPMAFLFYAPVALISSPSPTALILAASALNLTVVATLGVVLVGRTSACLSDRLLAVIVGLHLILTFPSLRYSLFCIHADAPALLLGGMGCGLVVLEPRLLSWRRSFFASLTLAGAVWAKQTVLPLYLAAAILAYVRGGTRSVLRFALATILTAALVSGLFVWCFGFKELYENMLVVPARHPWMQMSLATGEIYRQLPAIGFAAHAKVVIAECLHLVRSTWPLWTLLVAAAGIELLPHSTKKLMDLLRTRWGSFLLVAILLFPTAALGRTKVGGEVNHESFVVLFLCLASLCWLLEFEFHPRTRTIILGATLATLTLINLPRVLAYSGWESAANNENEAAFHYDAAHPGRVYFPWNPLTTVLTSGQAYHFDYGVFDRNMGGAEVTREHLEARLPRPRPIIASYIAHHDYILKHYFPDYVALSEDPELPGWKRYGPP